MYEQKQGGHERERVEEKTMRDTKEANNSKTNQSTPPKQGGALFVFMEGQHGSFHKLVCLYFIISSLQLNIISFEHVSLYPFFRSAILFGFMQIKGRGKQRKAMLEQSRGHCKYKGVEDGGKSQ
jgi:hypothetical protein